MTPKAGSFERPYPVARGNVKHPPGIFSVIQKDADHHSNLYDDASMPHMQRLTWSGIALHGGHLPGYPASHGCVRMPFDLGFSPRLMLEPGCGGVSGAVPAERDDR